MGMFEDDRIRQKNAVYNQAYQLYENLRKEGLNDNDIQLYVADIQPTDLSRNDIYSAVLSIARGDKDGKST